MRWRWWKKEEEAGQGPYRTKEEPAPSEPPRRAKWSLEKKAAVAKIVYRSVKLFAALVGLSILAFPACKAIVHRKEELREADRQRCDQVCGRLEAETFSSFPCQCLIPGQGMVRFNDDWVAQ